MPMPSCYRTPEQPVCADGSAPDANGLCADGSQPESQEPSNIVWSYPYSRTVSL